MAPESKTFSIEVDPVDEIGSQPEEKFLQQPQENLAQQSMTQPNSMRFDYKPDEIISLADSIIKTNMAKVDAIVHLSGPRTFTNTILAYAKFE